jgi:hypothetical protein
VIGPQAEAPQLDVRSSAQRLQFEKPAEREKKRGKQADLNVAVLFHRRLCMLCTRSSSLINARDQHLQRRCQGGGSLGVWGLDDTSLSSLLKKMGIESTLKVALRRSLSRCASMLFAKVLER